MSNKFPSKAFLLVAGLGTRLGDVTKDTPKCLIEVAGKPILQHVIEKLKDSGVKQLLINLHYYPEQIKSFLKQTDNFGMEIAFSFEEELLETGGAVKKAAWFIDPSEPFFVLNGDILTDLPLRAVWEVLGSEAIGALGGVDRVSASRLVVDDQNRFVRQQVFEPPYPNNTRAYASVACYHPRLLKFLSAHAETKFSMRDIWKSCIASGEKIYVSAPPESYYWFDIGTPETLAAARAKLAVVGSGV